MFRGILVPLDGSVFAEQALPFALSLARRTAAELHPVMVHLGEKLDPVVRMLSLGSGEDAAERLKERERAYLESVSERLEAARVRTRTPALLRGEVAPALAEHVERHEIDGVAMATHGRGGLEQLWMPSVADALLHRVRVPMLLVHPDRYEVAETPDPAPPFETVLVGLDGSPDAEAALELALRLGSTDARYLLLRVVPPPPLLSSTYIPHASRIYRKESEARRTEARTYLEAVAARIADGAPRQEILLPVDNRPSVRILHAAAKHGADLIVLGTHGHSMLRNLLFGSVTRSVLREPTVPVLVARAGGGG